MKNNQSFDKIQYLKMAVSQFINKPSIEAIETVYSQLTRAARIERSQLKMDILKICKDAFVEPGFIETISNAQKQGKTKTELVSMAFNHLALRVFKREYYDMSSLCCEGMLSHEATPEKNAIKDSADNSIKIKDSADNSIEIKDIQGNTILIELLDTINFSTNNIVEYIRKYKITRYSQGEPRHSVVYTVLDFPRLSPGNEKTEYYRAVANHLLSIKNIEDSHTNGYIGSLTETTPETRLKVGEEHFERESNNKFSSYRVQVSPNQALYYDRTEYEAVINYLKKQQEKKQNDGR